MPNYKLRYFEARARGEPVRMMFVLKGQDFEDVRYDYFGEEWQKIKNDKKRVPFGVLPVLEIDGKVMVQSGAIHRYLAREFGYYGKTNEEDAKIDVICEIVVDIEGKLNPTYTEDDEAKRTAFLVKARDTDLKPFFDCFVESLQKSSGKYFLGNRITLADLAVFNTLDFFMQGRAAVAGYFDSYPTLLKYYEGIKTDSPLASYFKTRPTPTY